MLIAVHLVPLMLGILTRGTVLAAAALAVGLAALVKPAVRVRPTPERHAPPPPSGPASWALAALAAAFAAVAALADLGRWAGDELVGVDPLTFHLPNVGRWIQLHSMWQIDQFVPLLAHGNYPNNGDVVLLSTVLPWHNDFLVRLPITFFLVTTAIAVFAVARELRAPHAASRARRRRRRLAAGRRHRDDPARAARLAHVDDVRLRRAVPPAPRAHAAGARTSCSPGRARDRGRDEVVRRQLGRGRRRDLDRRAARASRERAARPARARPPCCATACSSAASRCSACCRGCCATSLLSDNPVFPLKVAPFGLTIFDAPPDVIRDQVGFTIADYAGDAGRPAAARGRDRRGARGSRRSSAALALAARRRARARGAARRRPRARRSPPARSRSALLYTVTPGHGARRCAATRRWRTPTRATPCPALLIAVPVAAWVAGRLPRLAALAAGGARWPSPRCSAPTAATRCRPARRRARRGRPRAARRRGWLL